MILCLFNSNLACEYRINFAGEYCVLAGLVNFKTLAKIAIEKGG